jgi:hypothetical protein
MSRQDIKTEYGTIHVSSPGPYDKYDNVNVYKQTDTRHVVLQGPALRAFKAAEQRVTPKRWKAKGRTRHILITGVGYRDYDLQKQLWLSDPGRYANPDYSMHVEALAVDVDQSQRWKGKTTAQTLYKIKKALLLENWHYGVSGEPWHASYTVTG